MNRLIAIGTGVYRGDLIEFMACDSEDCRITILIRGREEGLMESFDDEEATVAAFKKAVLEWAEVVQ